ncbi:50S ribosomal protein L24 [Candidatus Woesearchaeota archaeon]|nr:50S ribosomal protein L24 [Candidatus Woesearchaeota archaeon]
MAFVKTWNKSTQPRKQRKFRYKAPLHIRQKLVRVNLYKDLREKHGKRNAQVCVGDKVKIMRGQFTKKEGKVERVDLKREKVYVTSIEKIKKNGTKFLVALSPSNLMIVELNLKDKKRKAKLTIQTKTAPKAEEKTEKSE